MRRNLTPDDLGDLLQRPLVAVLATHRANGEILLSPVWHEWRDGGFFVYSWEGDVKVRHLTRDPHASIVVFESNPPYRGIEVEGAAVLMRDDVQDACARIRGRYEEPDPDEETPTTGQVLIRMAPGRVRAWDYLDEF